MSIWTISDLHLSFGILNKSMDLFGPEWQDHALKIEDHWRATISQGDLIIIAGDISWAMTLDDAMADLHWIDKLPGTKLIIKGNHDYWWPSASKLSKILPSSIKFIQNNAFNWNGITFGGTRLWDSAEYNFNEFIAFKKIKEKKSLTPEEWEAKKLEDEKIFLRELDRLKLSLDQLDPKAHLRIALTHYPPIGADLKPSRASAILEHYKIDICIFGHLHSLKPNITLFNQEARGVKYLLTSCDYLNFVPIQVK